MNRLILTLLLFSGCTMNPETTSLFCETCTAADALTVDGGAGGQGAGGQPATSSSTSSGEGGAGGTGGASTGCSDATQCHGTECAPGRCEDGVCGVANATQGTELAEQTTGDCRTAVCDGVGGVVFIAVSNGTTDDALDDANECTEDRCQNGAAAHNGQALFREPCAAGICNGSGACVACIYLLGDCPGGGVCINTNGTTHCKPPSCDDGLHDGTETDTDCGGGSCLGCRTGQSCALPRDCDSTICVSGSCVGD